MKHIITKSCFVIFSMGLLTSMENASAGKANRISKGHACNGAKYEYAKNTTCGQAPVVNNEKAGKDGNQAVDYDISLSPISRFIILQ